MSEATIMKLISEFTKLPEDKFTGTSHLIGLVSDSFILVELMLSLQEDLCITLSQQDLDNVRTVNDLISAIKLLTANTQ